jgi:hypothetical protein
MPLPKQFSRSSQPGRASANHRNPATGWRILDDLLRLIADGVRDISFERTDRRGRVQISPAAMLLARVETRVAQNPGQNRLFAD